MIQESVRAFIAVGLSVEARRTVTDALFELRRVAPHEVRWVDPEGAHLTIKFLGSVPTSALAAVEHALRRAADEVAAFNLGLGAAGAFPNVRAPRVCWIGLTGDLLALGRLQGRVEDALAEGGFAREARPFRPHLTLGRVRETAQLSALTRLSEALGRLAATAVVWNVDDVVLIRSTLTSQGAIYRPIVRVALRPSLPALA